MVRKSPTGKVGSTNLTALRSSPAAPAVLERVPDLQDEKEKELSAIQRTSADLYVFKGKRYRIKRIDRWNTGIMG